MKLEVDKKDKALLWVTLSDDLTVPIDCVNAANLLTHLWALDELRTRFPEASPADLAPLLGILRLYGPKKRLYI